MEPDERQSADQTARVVEIIQTVLRERAWSGDPAAAESIARSYVEVIPPERPPARLEMVTMARGGVGGGRSTKPSNVRLNMRKLVAAIAGGALTVVGSLQAPWMAVLAALVVWDSLWSAMQVELGEAEALVLWALWKHKDESDTISKAAVGELVREEARCYGRRTLPRRQLEAALSRLECMGCIASSEHAPGRYWLRELVSIERGGRQR